MNEAKIHNTSQNQQRDDPANVLIIDDDHNVGRFILEILARKGIRGQLASDERTALEFLDKGSYDLVFASEMVPKQAMVNAHGDKIYPTAKRTGQQDHSGASMESGFDLLRKIKLSSPELPVIMIGEPNQTEPPAEKRQNKNPVQDEKAEARNKHRLIATAVKAIRRGCCDFIIKPLVREKIESLLDTFLPSHSVSMIDSAQEDTRCLYRIVGRSAKLSQTVELAKRIAPTSSPVLISGESGTGKELISYLVHHKSSRAQGPYTKVNCAALSDSLLESELFGHEKGSFTGAYTQHRGRFEMAHGGTLLLDEISETPKKFQAKLLRVLEQQDFERVGGNENVRVDVRIISTTNKDLLQEVQEGRFRRDLYYRLSGGRLVISPLRERKEDLPDLVWHFVNLYAREVQRRITKLDPMMMEIFAKYHWPGNVRQVRNVVRTSLILGVGEVLSLADVSWLFDELQPLPEITDSNGAEYTGEQEQNIKHYPRSANAGLGGIPLEQIERRAILDTLRQTAGNQTRAAKVLGISDRTLRDKIRRYRRQGCLAASV